VLSPGQADAHPAPFSYLDIVFRSDGMEGTLVIHVIDARSTSCRCRRWTGSSIPLSSHHDAMT
jgi:hypothetical protein